MSHIYSSDFPFTIMDVVSLLRLPIRRRGAGHVYTDCPFCGDRRGKLGISPEKNVWRCNYCGEGGGMLTLYAQIYGISNSEAYHEIWDALATDGFAQAYEAPAKASSASAAESTQADRVSAETLHETYSALLSMLMLDNAHREHLRTARGLTDEQIESFGFKSTPSSRMCRTLTERLMKQGRTIKGVPGFFVNDYGKWTVKFYERTSGIIIPIREIDGLIHGLQIRLDNPIKDKDDPPEKTGTKYLPLSSTGKSMGSSAGSPVHFVGDPYARAVYVTEGALKADICHALTGRTFAATIGANNVAALDGLFALLKKNGAQQIVEADDMDKFYNKMVHSGAMKIHRMAEKNGLLCHQLVWNPNYKGMDDWLLAQQRKKNTNEVTTRMNFKEMYLHGLCDLRYMEDCTEQWHNSPDISVSLREYLGLTEHEYEVYLQGDVSVSFEALMNSQRQERNFRIYQLDLSGDRVIPFAFQGIEKMRAAGYDQPPASEYRLIYDGYFMAPLDQTNAEVLERVFACFNDNLPEGYHGRSVSMSDVIELYDKNDRRYFYCDHIGFAPVQFSPMLAKRGG